MATNPAFPRPRVNPRGHLRVLSFTIAMLAGLCSGLAPARAERVLVLSPTGDAPAAQRQVVESSIRTALEALSFDAVFESESQVASEAAAPENANDFRALGELLRSQYVLAPQVSFEPGGYTLTLRVGYAPRTRLETITVQVRAVREHDRLVAVLRAVLSPDGMGNAQQRFAGPDPDAAALESSAAEERARREAEEAAAAAAAEQARQAEEAERQRLADEEAARQAEEARQREEFEAREHDLAETDAATRWRNRERFGRPMQGVSGGLGMAGVLHSTPGAQGGMVAMLQGRYGHGIESVPGLELRAGLDIVFGATGGFDLTGGAVYLASPWRDARVHIGGGLDLGYYQAVTGNRVPQLLVRAEAVVAWHATDKLWLEASLPSFTVLSANGGVLTLGMSIRAGTRF